MAILAGKNLDSPGKRRISHKNSETKRGFEIFRIWQIIIILFWIYLPEIQLALQTLIVTSFLIILLTGCSFVDGLSGNNTSQTNQSNITNVETPPMNTTNQNPPVNEHLEQQWNLITKTEVESLCFKQAKIYAASQGYSESWVYDCKCNADESNNVKNYVCALNAVDGSHPLSVSCVKSQGICMLTIDGGSATYDFDSIEQLANQ